MSKTYDILSNFCLTWSIFSIFSTNQYNSLHLTYYLLLLLILNTIQCIYGICFLSARTWGFWSLGRRRAQRLRRKRRTGDRIALGPDRRTMEGQRRRKRIWLDLPEPTSHRTQHIPWSLRHRWSINRGDGAGDDHLCRERRFRRLASWRPVC